MNITNKIVTVIAIAVATFSPAVTFAAAPSHYFFPNETPDAIGTITANNQNQAPFGLSCSMSGFTKDSVVWGGFNKYEDTKNAYTYAIPEWGHTVPVFSDVKTFWVGTDVTKTPVDSNTLKVKYVSSGVKSMSFGATDGVTTEIVDCGSYAVSLEGPKPLQTLVLDNGVTLQY